MSKCILRHELSLYIPTTKIEENESEAIAHVIQNIRKV